MGAKTAFQLGAVEMSVAPLDAASIAGLPQPFVALLPAEQLTRLPAVTAVAFELLGAGCADIILAGRCAQAFDEHVRVLINQEGSWAASSPFEEISDACNAALLGALVRKAGIAFCLDDPDVLATLRGAAEANGWTATTPPPHKPDRVTVMQPVAKPAHKPKAKAMPASKPTLAKPTAKSKPKPKPKPKRRR